MKHGRFVASLVGLLLLAACAGEMSAPTPEPTASMANPASVFCEERGYTLEMRTEAGGTTGYCLFPDGSECEEWAFFRGECAPGNATWGSKRLELVLLESFPVQVQAQLWGTLPDNCTAVARVLQEFDPVARTITLRPIVETTAATGCKAEPTPFEQVVALDVLGLPAGEYQVLVGELSASFSLPADNVAPDAPPAGDVPAEMAEWPLVTNPNFGFSFRIPPGWIMTETTEQPHTLAGHQMQVASPDMPDVVFSVAYKQAADPMRITRSGMREGDFVSYGTLDFLGAPVAKTRLEFEGKVMGVYYDGAGEVTREPVTFTLALDYLGDSRTGAGISAETERLADLMVTSFSFQTEP